MKRMLSAAVAAGAVLAPSVPAHAAEQTVAICDWVTHGEDVVVAGVTVMKCRNVN